MTSKQNALQIVQNKMQLGEITAAQANIMMIQMEGVRLITGKIPADIRKALNAAVKAGELGHLKKDGLRPEAYHHKNGRSRAIVERDRVFRSKMETLSKVHVHYKDL